MTDWVLVFVAIFLSDVCWATYIKYVHASKPLLSGFWAVALFIPGAFVTLSYVQNHWLLIPASIGAFSGTAITVWWNKK